MQAESMVVSKRRAVSMHIDDTWEAKELLKDFLDYEVVWRVPERVVTDPNLRSEACNKVGP